MNRRVFLSGISATALLPQFTAAQEVQGNSHPFEFLRDISTGENFRFDEERYNLVIVMTAQESYSDCGGAFIGVHQIMTELNARDTIHPIMIMPRVADQSYGQSDLRNIARAQRSEYPITILSGDLTDIQAAIATLNGAFLEIDPQGKVSGHTQDAYFLTPSGNQLLSHRADDYFTFVPLIDRIIGRCYGGLNPSCW